MFQAKEGKTLIKKSQVQDSQQKVNLNIVSQVIQQKLKEKLHFKTSHGTKKLKRLWIYCFNSCVLSKFRVLFSIISITFSFIALIFWNTLTF